MPYFAYNVGGWVQKKAKMGLCNKSMAPYVSFILQFKYPKIILKIVVSF